MTSQNQHPIFFIHGFMGWGRDELNGYFYWGGKRDFESELQEAGFKVYSLSVGPVSSNWDRAVEAYAQIKGGCVDYGKTHSDTYGLIQLPEGKCYEGFYPVWDSNHPIHILGHSQGGQTALTLDHLLKTTFKDEASILLKDSHKNWITSITTISSPLNGTTLAPIIMDIFPFVQKLASWVGSIDNSVFEKFYDFDLEQWGLKRHDGESQRSLTRRIKESPIRNTRNFSSWDLSKEGAGAFNKLYQTNKDIFYFTYATYATKLSDNSNYHFPDSKMSWRLWPSAIIMGRTDSEDKVWNENDGIVNTVSMIAPSEDAINPIKSIPLEAKPLRGRWQQLEKLHWDHHQIIGGALNKEESEQVYNIYFNHLELLYSLPK